MVGENHQQPNNSSFLFLHFKTKKRKENQQKPSFEAKPKSLFKVFFCFFGFEVLGLVSFSIYITSVQKSCDFLENSFQERDHSKQYVCKLQEF
jgi:hypothetical protein